MHSWGGLHYGNNSSNKKTSFRVYIALPCFFLKLFFCVVIFICPFSLELLAEYYITKILAAWCIDWG